MSTTPKLTDYLAAQYPLSKEFGDYLAGALTSQKFSKGHTIHRRKKHYDIWFIESGLAKGSYCDDHGKEHVTRFWHEGEIILLGRQDPFAYVGTDQVVLLEDCVLTSLDTRAVHYLYEHFVEGPKLASKILLIDGWRADVKSYLCTLRASQSYQAFQEQFPANRLPLKDIASYLEITPGTLSEIRRKSF